MATKPGEGGDQRDRKHNDNEGQQGGQHGGKKRESPPDSNKRDSAYAPSEPAQGAKTAPDRQLKK